MNVIMHGSNIRVILLPSKLTYIYVIVSYVSCFLNHLNKIQDVHLTHEISCHCPHSSFSGEKSGGLKLSLIHI